LRFAITSPHQDVKRTCTSKLSFMHGVPDCSADVPVRARLMLDSSPDQPPLIRGISIWEKPP
jgi:hypothetical protein